MTGVFKQKYKIAVYDEDISLVKRIATTLKSWFSNKIEIKSYTNSREMILDLNLAKAKNKPFDITIMGPDEWDASSIVLKHTDPSMQVIRYKDDKTLKKDTAKLSLKTDYSIFRKR